MSHSRQYSKASLARAPARIGGNWVIILAAGDGTRVAKLTAGSGDDRPKQYWAPSGDESMLEWTLVRAERLVPSNRIVVVVAAQHRRFWQPILAGRLPPYNILVQPKNRGTAAGILLPALHIFPEDPAARVTILPADHFVEQELLLHESLEQAGLEVSEAPQKLVLLGMAMKSTVLGYGWIVPGPAEESGVCPVRRFVEKPEACIAERMRQEGALASCFIFTAKLETLIKMMHLSVPHLVRPFLALCAQDTLGDPRHLEQLYASIPTLDFSHHVLTSALDWLRVLPVPACGWSDLGAPERIRDYQMCRPKAERRKDKAARGLPTGTRVQGVILQSLAGNPLTAAVRLTGDCGGSAL